MRCCCRLPVPVMETNDVILRMVPAKFRAYSMLAGGIITMLTFGTTYTFGNLLPYLVSYFRWKVDPSMTAGSLIWLQTMMSGLPFGMLAGGYLEQRLGGRKASIIGAVIYTSGIASSFFAVQNSFAALLFTMGFWASMGSSIAYNSILTTAHRWMPENVGFAGGLIVGGYGCGAFILSPLQTTFINPLDYTVDEDGYFTQTDLLERVPYVFLVMATLFFTLQIIGLLFVGQPNEELTVESEPLVIDSRNSVTISEQLRTSTFIVLFLSLTCNSAWVQLSSGLYKAYGQKFIHSDLFLSLVGSMASIFNASSRVAWGMVVDQTSYQTAMSIVCTVGAVLVWMLPTVQAIGNDVLFLITICGMFTCVGGTFSLFPYITQRCFGSANFGVMYGIIQCALGLAGIIAGLLSQFLLPIVGYDILFIIAGSFMAVSFALTSVLHLTSVVKAMVRRESESVVVNHTHDHDHDFDEH